MTSLCFDKALELLVLKKQNPKIIEFQITEKRILKVKNTNSYKYSPQTWFSP